MFSDEKIDVFSLLGSDRREIGLWLDGARPAGDDLGIITTKSTLATTLVSFPHVQKMTLKSRKIELLFQQWSNTGSCSCNHTC